MVHRARQGWTRKRVLDEIEGLRGKLAEVSPVERGSHERFLKAAAMAFQDDAVGLWLRPPRRDGGATPITVVWDNPRPLTIKASVVATAEQTRWLIRRAVAVRLTMCSYGIHRAPVEALLRDANVTAVVRRLPYGFWRNDAPLVARQK